MDSLTIAAASGMRSRLETLDLLANNIANGSTAGFKADHESYERYFRAELPDGLDAQALPDPTALPVVGRHWTDHSQGVLTATGSSLDLALGGEGFFSVQGPNGSLYTRNGSFHLSATGQLQSTEGYSVLDREGKPITVDPNAEIRIARDGAIWQGSEIRAQVGISSVEKPQEMPKRGHAYFQMTELAGKVQPAAGTQVHQGKLEQANVGPAETAVKLVSVMRQFEMLQRALTVGTEMNRRGVEDVAKISG